MRGITGQLSDNLHSNSREDGHRSQGKRPNGIQHLRSRIQSAFFFLPSALLLCSLPLASHASARQASALSTINHQPSAFENLSSVHGSAVLL